MTRPSPVRYKAVVLSTFLSFAATTLLLAIVPGPTTALVLRQTLRHGRRIAFATTLGNSTGVLLWALGASFGISGLLAASARAFFALRLAGAAVLFVLGVKALLAARQRAPDLLPSEGSPQSPSAVSFWGAYQVGLWTNLTNPKALVFAISFLPQFIPAEASMLATALPLAGVWCAVDTLWFVAMAGMVDRAKVILGRTRVRQRIEQAMGILLIGFGLRLAVSER